MTNLTWRVLGRASVFILALVLALGTTVPALANDDDGLERQGFSGIVTAVDLEAGTITVETEEDELITIALTGDTRVRLPSGDVHSAAQVGVEVGASVAVLAELEDDSLTALWVLVKPERPQVGHLLGTVISMEDNLITIVDAQGNAHTVRMPGQALQGLQVGDMATFVVGQTDTDDDENNGEEDENNGDEDPALVAHALVSAKQIQERVAKHASSLRQRAEARDVPVDDAEKRIIFLSELMYILQEHVEGVLTIVLNKVPEPAKAAILEAREQARIGFEEARETIRQGQDNNDNGGKPEWTGPSDNDNTSDNGKPAGAGSSANTSDNGKPEDAGRLEGAGLPGKPGE